MDLSLYVFKIFTEKEASEKCNISTISVTVLSEYFNRLLASVLSIRLSTQLLIYYYVP